MIVDEPTQTEQKLIVAAREGDVLVLGLRAPDAEADSAVVVRATVLRDLMLGRHGELDPRGVRLSGALVEGELDLSHVTAAVGLEMKCCRLTKRLTADGCRLPWLSLSGSHLADGLAATRLTVGGSVFLDGGFTSTSGNPEPGSTDQTGNDHARDSGKIMISAQDGGRLRPAGLSSHSTSGLRSGPSDAGGVVRLS